MRELRFPRISSSVSAQIAGTGTACKCAMFASRLNCTINVRQYFCVFLTLRVCLKCRPMFESIKMMGVECGLYCIVYYCIDACAYRNDVAGCKTTSGFENDILSYRFTHMMMSKPMGARRVRGQLLHGSGTYPE